MNDMIAAPPLPATQDAPPQDDNAPVVLPRLSEEEYLRVWAEQGYEWVDGELNKVTTNLKHYGIVGYIHHLLLAYFKYRPIGRMLGEPFILRMDAKKRRYREPDGMIVFNENSVGTLTDTGVIGSADICIEVVSPESVQRDYSIKMLEYQNAGVREYWVIDPERNAAVFFRRDEDGKFESVLDDEHDNDKNVIKNVSLIYTTPLLPDLQFDTAVLWRDVLPDIVETVEMVQAMLAPKDTPA